MKESVIEVAVGADQWETCPQRTNPLHGYKRIRPRDSQRSKVYRWERNLPGWDDPALTFCECGGLIHRLWPLYVPRLPPPRVTDGRGRRTACGGRRAIKLPVFARTRIIVLHELAHAIVDQYTYTRRNLPPFHGGLFMRVFIDLLVRFSKIDRALCHVTAEIVKLDIATSHETYVVHRIPNLNR